MTNARPFGSSLDDTDMTGGAVDGIRRSIADVSGLHQRVEQVPPAAAPASAPQRADEFRVLLAAQDEANRVAAEAASSRADAAARGRQILAAAQERAALVLADAQSDADELLEAAADELAGVREETAARAREILTQAAVDGDALRRAARAECDRIAERTAAWLAEQQESAVILGRQCREEARSDAAQIAQRARDEGRERASAECGEAVAAAVAAILADSGAVLTSAENTVSIVMARIEQTAASANRLDTGAGLALAGLHEAQQAMTGLLRGVTGD